MLFLEGALIALAGVVLGRFLPARRRTPKPLPPPKPVCGCGHGLHDHDPTTNACHGRVKTYRHDGFSEVLDGYAKCSCWQYQGPTPLPEFFAPEIGASP